MLIKKFPSFPSLVISADELNPIGDFAKAQAQFLEPGQEAAERLAMALREKKIGVVAHFYMDPEVRKTYCFYHSKSWGTLIKWTLSLLSVLFLS